MKRLIGAIIIGAIAFAGARYAYINFIEISFFEVSSIEISCPDSFDKNKVIKASRLKVGESIFRQDFKSAARYILELPGAEQVKVERVLPSKVKIEIFAEEIVLFVKAQNLYGLTRTSKIVPLSSFNAVLPIVTGIDELKKTNYNEKLKLCYALGIYSRLTRFSKTLADRLSEINVENRNEAVMYFDPGGVKVIIPLRDYDKALSRLVQLDNKGILGNSGSFDMTAGKVVVRNGV